MKSLAAILESLYTRLESDTTFDDVRRDSSLVGLLTRAIAYGGLYSVYAELDEVEAAYDITKMSGDQLDELGAAIGLSRRPINAASSSTSVLFYLNAAATVNLTITAGTLVWSSLDPSITFSVTSDVTIPVGEYEAIVPVTASSTGSRFNIAAGRLDTFSRRTGTLAALMVTNLSPIQNGSDGESDMEYRTRIIMAQRAVYGIESDYLHASLLSLPGIVAVEITANRRGAGSVDIMVQGTNGEVEVALVAQASRLAEAVLPLRNIKVYTPVAVNVTCQIKLVFSSAAMAVTASSAARRVIVAHINSLGAGQGIGTNTIESLARQVTGVIGAEVVYMARDGAPAPLATGLQVDADEVLRVQATGVTIA